MAEEKNIPTTLNPVGEVPEPPTVLDSTALKKAVQEDLERRIREADSLIGNILTDRKLRLAIQPSVNVLENGVLQYGGTIIYVPVD